MSLRAALNTATSSLLTIETQMSVTAQNIANADTDGYTKKETNLSASTYGGVSVSSISSTADQYLIKSAISSVTTLGETSEISEYMDSVGDLMGTVDTDGESGTSLSSYISDFSDALSSLSDSPESDSLAYQVVAAADDLASALRSSSSDIQDLREQADNDISSAVSTVNAALNTIDELNDQISETEAQGGDATTLEDQRTTALQTIAEQMNITYFTNSNGDINIYTEDGTALLNSSVHELEFSSAGTMTASLSYPDNLSGITVNGTDITDSIDSGCIGGLLTVRDETLTNIQDELDELATGLKTTINAISNTGSSVPAPESYTSSEEIDGSEQIKADGNFRIALLDSDGIVQDFFDFDMSGYKSINDFISDINTSLSGVTAEIDEDTGKLVISSDDEDLGIAMLDLDSAVVIDGDESNTQGVAEYLGLNDIFTGTGASDIAVSDALLDDSSLVPVGQLSDDDELSIDDYGVAEGDNTVAEAMVDAFSADVDFSSAGNLADSSTTLSSYTTMILSDISTRMDEADSAYETAETRYSTQTSAIASASGVNIDEETAAMTELENSYSVASSIIEAVNSMYDALLDAVS